MNYLIRRQSKRYIIIWFNSPFIKVVSTNVSKTFLQLLTKNFPRSRKLHKILNRNTVKVSCMNNMSKIIKGHNKKVTSKPHYQTLKYNCRKKCILGWQKENRRAVSVNTSYHLNITDILIRQHVHTYTYTDTCVYIYIYIILSLKCKIYNHAYCNYLQLLPVWNLIGWNSVHISDIFNCYSANINGMWNARNLGGIY